MTNTTSSPGFSCIRSRALWFLATSLLLAPGCKSCMGCGAEEEPEPDLGPVDTFEPEPKDDPLAGAAKEAKEKAVSVAVGRSDEARFVASDIKAAQKEDEPSGPHTIPADPEGSIPTEELQKVFRKNSEATRECYERQLKKNPSLQGRVILRLTIDADGSVARANVTGDTLHDSYVNACIEGRVRRWKFPEPKGGAARVSKPFSFNPKKN